MLRALPRRRAGIAALCFAVLASCAVATGAVAEAVLQRNLLVPMRDGVILRADLWLPAREGRHPTLVYRTPYDKTATTDGALVRKAVARGYAVLVQDVRGRYASDGEFAAYTQEGRDGFDTIEWAAAQPWSSARIGSFGLSYPGAVQWLAAIESPPHLVAMVPAMSFATPAHFWYTGGVWDGSWLAWTWLNIAPDLRRRLGVTGPRTEAEAEAAWSAEGAAMQEFRPLGAMPAFKGIAPWYYEWMRHGPWDPWWQWAELSGKYARVPAAVLNISGWHDEMYGPSGATMNFAGLVQARGGDVQTARTQVVVGPWTHGTDLATTRIGTREMGAAALDYDELVLRWMDRWLREIDNGVDREAPVRLYAMGADAWRTGSAWPPAAQPRSLYLGGAPVAGRAAGMLDWNAPAAGSSASFVSDPAQPVRDPHRGAAGGLDFRALSGNEGVLIYETGVLAEDLELLGPIEAEIHISVDRPDSDLWVKLLDVQPDGTAYNLMSTGLDVIRASYRNSRPERELLVPGQIYRLDLRTLMTANRFLRGHRLRVAIMASFAPNLSRNLHTGELEFESARATPARITVHSGGAHASRLVVPVAPTTRPAGT